MFVVGGSGITFALAAVQDLIQVSRVRALYDWDLTTRIRGITMNQAGSSL